MDQKAARGIHRGVGLRFRQFASKPIPIQFPRERFLRMGHGHRTYKNKDTYFAYALLASEDRKDLFKFYKKMDELRDEIGERPTAIDLSEQVIRLRPSRKKKRKKI